MSILSTPRTFRLNSWVLREIEREAARQRISVNSLVNRLLEGYVVYGRYREHFDTITLNRETFLRLLEEVDEEKLGRIALERGAKTPRELIPLCGRGLDFDGVKFFLKTVLQDHCHWFIMHIFEGDEVKIILRHQWGGKWSTWLKHYVKALFKEILRVDVEFLEVTDNYIFFKVPKRA